MAVKKKELYRSLWASCDQLRGGMDASQYKDYILTLLFMKYVTDKFEGDLYADITIPEGGSFHDLEKLKGNKNIGEEIDKVIAKLAEASGNQLRGVIDNAHFNDESKLGKGQEMIDKLTKLISIFQRPEFDFRNNKAGGDDILGDAYEYLMRNFATESGKSKGQFYTPAEVSRVLAQVIGIDKIQRRPKDDWSVYDPACGSGSLLIRAADAAPFSITPYGQEKDVTTAGLAKMNMVLHNKAEGVIASGNTFSDPEFKDDKDDSKLKRFDFIVVNPPFSLKNWTDGLQEYGRFDEYDDRPPEKNGDFAWLLHVLKSLKNTGKAAVILPHGVLFRGNAEATIRKAIIDKGLIEGIIGLPANLFYGTGIPACILVIDKEFAAERKGIFMIDASRGFVKDGNKNRLREEDIYKIVHTFNNRIEDDPKYARFVYNDEIKKKNGYNLNIPRYIDSSAPEDQQDIDAHLRGGIPIRDIDSVSMARYWDLFPGLKSQLFASFRPGYARLNVPKEQIRDIIYNNPEFSAYADQIDAAFSTWKAVENAGLRNIHANLDAKKYIAALADSLLQAFSDLTLLDKYDIYEALLSYWRETMEDDALILKYDGYAAGREIENLIEYVNSKRGELEEKIIGWDGKLIPKKLLEETFFAAERREIDETQARLDDAKRRLEELTEEQSGENGFLQDFLTDKGKINEKSVSARVKSLKNSDADPEEYWALSSYLRLSGDVKEYGKTLKKLTAALEQLLLQKYPALTDDEIKDLLIERKWFASVYARIRALYATTSHNMAGRVAELAERYENALPALEQDAATYEAKVRTHLERMGFSW